MRIIGKIQKWWFGVKYQDKNLDKAHKMSVKELLNEIHLIKQKKSKLSHKGRMAVLARYQNVMENNYLNRK